MGSGSGALSWDESETVDYRHSALEWDPSWFAVISGGWFRYQSVCGNQCTASELATGYCGRLLQKSAAAVTQCGAEQSLRNTVVSV